MLLPLLGEGGDGGLQAEAERLMSAPHFQCAHRLAGRRRLVWRRISCDTQGRLTYLPTKVRGQLFYLYLFVDLFSRKAVGWQTSLANMQRLHQTFG